MNIIFLMKVFEIWGQEVVTATLARCFSDRGHHISIVSFTPPNPMMVARLDKRVTVRTLEGFRYSKGNVRMLRNILCSENTDIVINQWGLPFLPALTLKKAVKGLGIKVIAVYHNDPSTNGKLKAVENILEKTRNPLKKMLFRIVYGFLKQVTSASMRYVYHSSDRYVVLSKSFIGGFRSFTGLNEVEKLSVITNPVTVDEVNYEFDFSSKRKEILFVGRIDCNQKKVNRVIDTWALLEQRYPDWRLTIVGDGPDRENLEKQVRELKLRNVSFEGFQNPREYYERASILLLTSEFEGFPLVLPECMSFGVIPAVYGSYSAVYDIVEDGKNGLILPYDKKGYNAALMAEKLSVLMQSSDERQRIAENAIVTSCKYALETIYQSWEQLFRVKMNVDEKQLKK